MKGTLLMVGPSPTAKGGIATWIRDFESAEINAERRYLVTHRDGTWKEKLDIAIRAYLRFPWILSDVTVIHVHTSSYASYWRKLPIYLLGRMVGRKVVIHVHGSDFEVFYNGLDPFRRYLVRLGLGLADVVLALSDSWASFLRRITGTPVEILPNGVHAARFVEAVDLPATAVFVGELSERKGVDDLLEAVAILAGKGHHLPVTLAGEGAIERYRRKAESLGIANLISFPGWVDSGSTPRLLASHGIFLLPSHREGLPIAILEAMAAGLPVVSCPVGGIPDVVRDGVTGFLAPAGDPSSLAECIEHLLDPEVRRSMGRAGRERLRAEWDWAGLVQGLERLYERLEDSCRR